MNDPASAIKRARFDQLALHLNWQQISDITSQLDERRLTRELGLVYDDSSKFEDLI